MLARRVRGALVALSSAGGRLRPAEAEVRAGRELGPSAVDSRLGQRPGRSRRQSALECHSSSK